MGVRKSIQNGFSGGTLSENAASGNSSDGRLLHAELPCRQQCRLQPQHVDQQYGSRLPVSKAKDTNTGSGNGGGAKKFQPVW